MERTEGIASVTTRTPESSSVRRWRSSVKRGASVAPVAAVLSPAVPAPGAIATATAAGAAAAVPAAPAAAVAGAHARQLLGRLPRDLRVVGEPEPDPAALLVD